MTTTKYLKKKEEAKELALVWLFTFAGRWFSFLRWTLRLSTWNKSLEKRGSENRKPSAHWLASNDSNKKKQLGIFISATPIFFSVGTGTTGKAKLSIYLSEFKDYSKKSFRIHVTSFMVLVHHLLLLWIRKNGIPAYINILHLFFVHV